MYTDKQIANIERHELFHGVKEQMQLLARACS